MAASTILLMVESKLNVYRKPSNRIGMGVDEMQDVAKFFARSLLSEENPETVKSDIARFKSEFQTVKYAIQEGPAYPEI